PAGNGWATAPKYGQLRTASFETEQPAGDASGSILTFNLHQVFNSGQHSIGRFRISVTTSSKPVKIPVIPAAVAAILKIEPDKRDDKQKAELIKHYRSVDGELKKLTEALANSKKPRAVDPKLKQLRDRLAKVSQPLPIDPKLKQLRADVELSKKQLTNPRLTVAQDIAWALINSPAFLFNR
ncbi:MAG: hypothetical protein VB857_04820, partial [Pirellulaceae bacterium]